MESPHETTVSDFWGFPHSEPFLKTLGTPERCSTTSTIEKTLREEVDTTICATHCALQQVKLFYEKISCPKIVVARTTSRLLHETGIARRVLAVAGLSEQPIRLFENGNSRGSQNASGSQGNVQN
jgi:hypothetical protein